jgi:DNA modification methylase
MINEIFTGNNVEILRTMTDDYVDLTVTSPPYDGLRTYNGYSFDFDSIARELYRVTKPGGVVVWVVGDATRNGSESLTSFRQALYFKEIGFNVHDTMIYRKSNAMPQTHRRYEQEFEYMFVFSKGKPKTFNPLLIPCSTAGQIYDYSKRKSASSVSENGVGRNREEKKATKSHKQRGNIWSYQIGNNKSTKDKAAFNHPAIFPENLAEEHIVSWSNHGDIVLDPFGGSGTTAKMAKKNGRQFIHIDISEEYNEIARERIAGIDYFTGK